MNRTGFILGMIVAAVLCGTFIAAPTPKKPDALPKPAVAPFEDIQGYYDVSGKDGNDKEYHGIAIIHRVESTYLVQWIMGGSAFRGAGMRDGDKLIVGFVQVDRPIQGVYSYKITKGKLVGKWVSVPGDGVARTEEMILLKSMGKTE